MVDVAAVCPILLSIGSALEEFSNAYSLIIQTTHIGRIKCQFRILEFNIYIQTG